MKTPLVSIAILSWNGREDTLECLKSLRGVDYPNYHTILVDNGSTDGTIPAVREGFPEVEILETGENLGCAGGNNAGIRRSLEIGADAVLLLNNDTTLDPAFLSILVENLYSSSDIGATNPTIYYYDEPDVVWSAGGSIDERTGIAYQRHLNEADRGQFKNNEDVDYGISAAMLVRREAIETAGLMDQDFFIYYDETEWCCRARDAGYRILYVPQARIWHKVSKVMNKNSAGQLYYFCRNRLLFMKKRGAGTASLFRIAAADFGRMSLAMALRGEGKQSKAVLRAVSDFYWGRFGRVQI
ncbi:MAG: glycosyltransferase family 2 protein [Armatimonadetes bacterium]|nr:glycosyltransferase family 2 protein [Armatimonadota bacterium]